MQRSDLSKHSPAVAKLVLHLPLFLSRFARQSEGFRVKGQTVTSRHDQQPRNNLRLWSHHQQRVPYSFQRQPATSLTLVPTSFPLAPGTQPDESHTRSDELRARSRFATHGRDHQRTSNQRAPRAPQQGAEEKNSTALRYHVCRVFALCPARHFVLDTCDGLCAHG